MPRVTAWAEARLPGFHQWPGAPPRRDYLAARHRHLFHLRAGVVVSHDDRDIEFHALRQLICDWWDQSGGEERGPSSCEAMTRELAGYLTEQHLVVAFATVSEDGESGATYTPEPSP